jgi:hypothetical protein
MKKAQGPNKGASRTAFGVSAIGTVAGLVAGCSADEAPKAWSALSTCLAGKSAQEPLAARFKQLRLIQLGSNPKNAAKDAWPARCNRYADTLYAALSTSGTPALLRRQMQQKFGCSDDKATCNIPNDPAFPTMATDLWTAAEGAQLKAEAAADVPAPEAAPPPLLDERSWKSFSDKPAALSGPALTPDGRAVLVLKSREGRTRPKACEFAAGFGKVHCVEANAQVPELPGQTVELVNDEKGLFASSLTEKGLVAYNLQTGETSDVRGMGRRLIRDGVTVEKGAKDDLNAPPAMPLPGEKPKKGAKAAKGKPTVKEEGFIAVELKGGKAGKDVKLPIKATVGDPIAIGNQIVYLNPVEGGAELVAQSLAGGRLKPMATLKGQFSGALHSCRKGDQLAVAAYGGRAGQQTAKATAGEGKTQLSLAIFQNGAWSKTLEATLPFDRVYDSDLVCTKSGVSLTWVKPDENGVLVGRIDCSADGCKAADTKVAGLESKWWWAVGPVGDKVLLLWRAAFGETKARVAPLAELGSAKDTLVFDSPDFGGPTAGELSPLFADDAALLVFRNEQPVALQVGSDGTPKLIGL